MKRYINNPIFWLCFISLLPTLLWIALNEKANHFGIIDSLSASGFIATLSCLLLLVSRPLSLWFCALASAFMLLFTQVSFEYYSFYGSYISSDTLLLFRDLLTASGQFVSAWAILGLCLLLGAFHLLVKHVAKARVGLKKTIYGLCLLSFSTFALSFSHYKYDQLTKMPRPGITVQVELESQSPVLFFMRSTEFWQSLDESEAERMKRYNFEMLAANIVKGADVVLPKAYHVDNYEDLLLTYPGYQTGYDDLRPLNSKPEQVSTASLDKNVILIVLESVRAFETGLYESEYSITPNLDKIAKEGITASHFYANNRQTVKGEQALLCSAIDYRGDAPYAVKHGKFNGRCLPRILSDSGFDTYWYHGYTKEFFNRKEYHQSIGFEHIYAKEEFIADGYDENQDIGWGVPDKYLFSTVLNKLEAHPQDKPFFAQVLTLTNHQPFDWNYGELNVPENEYSGENEIYANYQKGIHYTDAALGEFWDAFIQSPLADNTIVIITADHGVPFYHSEALAEADKREILFRIPFIIIDPDNDQPREIDLPLSQLDLTPTLLSLLNINAENSFIGRPFLGQQQTASERPILLHSSDGVSLRFGDLMCNPKGQMCAVGDNSCTTIGAMQCKTSNEALLQYGQDVISYNDYLQLALETGFTVQ